MKQTINDIRSLIASFLIMAIFKVLPTGNEFKLRFAQFIQKNINEL